MNKDAIYTFTMEEIIELTGLGEERILEAVDKGEVDFKIVQENPYVFTINPKVEDVYFNIKDCAEILKVEVEDVEFLIQSGNLKAYQQRDGSYLIRSCDIYQF